MKLGPMLAAGGLVACTGAAGPAIERVEPAAAVRGATVIVRGAGFCGPAPVDADGACVTPPSGTVTLGLDPPMVRVPIVAWSEAAIAIQVPATAPLGPVEVIVTVDGRSSNAATLEIMP